MKNPLVVAILFVGVAICIQLTMAVWVLADIRELLTP